MEFHAQLQGSVLTIHQCESIDLTYLFIRTWVSLTMMFHLLGPETTSKGMIYDKDGREK